VSPGAGALYLCYLPLEEPLVQTQVVPYLRGLAGAGYRMHLLTFETGRVNPAEREQRRAELAGQGITWHHRRYHQRPSLPATAYDVAVGTAHGVALCRKHHIDLAHARGLVPAAMALAIRRLRSARFVFDVRGLMAEEYEDAGIWRRGGAAFRATKRVERAAMSRADGVVVLTSKTAQSLPAPRSGIRIEVIPTCVDTHAVVASTHGRQSVRRELGVGDRTVMAYVGKFGGWYAHREMVDFFADARAIFPDLYFLVLSQGDRDMIEAEFARRRASRDDYWVGMCAPAEVPAFLAAADFGISLIRPVRSKLASSPTKLGEYLAAGLPVVANAGIGDVEELLSTSGTGVFVRGFGNRQYLGAAAELRDMRTDPGLAARCRATAEEHLSLDHVGIPRYRALYATVLGRPGDE
jgi:glycosyltransferase involved in cell wall biosynthesis